MSVFVLQGASGGRRKIDYHQELNQEQLNVVLHADGPSLVLAGAGSGKTRTVTYRVAYLLEQGVDPSRILLLTFTNKASREMIDRVTLLVGPDAKGLWGGTFHAIANRLLRKNARLLGYTNNFTILDQSDAQSLVKAVMKEMRIDPKARRFPTAAVVQNIISFARNTLTSVPDVLELKHPNFLDFADDIEEIGKRYGERKKAANAMDFDDLLVNWVNLMQREEFGKRISDQFLYVLVDEYQDTNALQAFIVEALGSVHQNVLVVGDDAQSIYAFRGADVKNILQFPDRWPNTSIYKLLTNYRSTPEILDLANESLSHNVEQFQKDLAAVRPTGARPLVVPCSSARQEASFVAEQLLALRAEGVALGNMAVLFRSSAHSQALEFELLKRDIPYEYRGGMKFFERAHIKDALAYLRIHHNPQDEAAWLRVLNMQTGIGAATAAALVERIRTFPDLKAIASVEPAELVPPRAQKGWASFADTALSVSGHAPEPGPMLRAVLGSAYQEYLEREYPDWRERQEDLEQLVIFAEGYQDATGFLADIALYDDVLAGRDKGAGGEEERTVLTTIHQAKGLEWDTVFVIHLADSAFPNRRAMSEEGGLEEERRLFYVAVTRARTRLFLTYPITSGYDTLMLNQPSLFLEEISPRLTERMEVREGGGKWGEGSRSSRRPRATGDVDRSDWSWDEGYEEPSIQIGRDGERSSKTVWKSSSGNGKKPPTSFLKDVDEL